MSAARSIGPRSFSKESNVTPDGSRLVRHPFLIVLPSLPRDLSHEIALHRRSLQCAFSRSSSSVSRRLTASNHAKTPRITLNSPEAIVVSNTRNSNIVNLPDCFKETTQSKLKPWLQKMWNGKIVKDFILKSESFI